MSFHFASNLLDPQAWLAVLSSVPPNRKMWVKISPLWKRGADKSPDQLLTPSPEASGEGPGVRAEV